MTIVNAVQQWTHVIDSVRRIICVEYFKQTCIFIPIPSKQSPFDVAECVLNSNIRQDK